MWVSARTPDDAPLLERQYEKLYRIIDARVNIRQPYLARSCWDALEAGGTLPADSRWHTLLDKSCVDLIEATATRILAEGEQGFPLRRRA